VPEDLTFEKCPNDMDSQFIVQAVGEILTEIQKLLAQQNEELSENANSTTKLSVEQPRPKKKAAKQPQRTLSDDE
jgi:Sec-independent protein translocase protein TatA